MVSDERICEMQEELHTLGNCLAQVKMGSRLMVSTDITPERRKEIFEEVTEAILDAESAFRLLSAQLK
ncbi:MAG: hypothetical protein AB8G16_05930 [Gammaproteobacteria bacterium]